MLIGLGFLYFLNRFLHPMIILTIVLLLLFLIVLYVWQRVRKSAATPFRNKTTLKLCVVLGSGGHTTELLRLVQSLGRSYWPRVYIIGDTDRISETKVKEMEAGEGEGGSELHKIPRSREVRQSYLSSVFSTLNSVVHTFPLLIRLQPDVILCNGPGTCIPVCAISWLLDLVRYKDSRIIFVESLCRVKKLSLSGQILYRTGMADKILVHWSEQKKLYPATEFIGRLL